MGARTELVDVEPRRFHGGPVLFQRRPLSSRERDEGRCHERLARERPVPPERLVDDPLTRGVLVDEDHPLLRFRHPVDRAHASNELETRVGPPARDPPGFGRRGAREERALPSGRQRWARGSGGPPLQSADRGSEAGRGCGRPPLRRFRDGRGAEERLANQDPDPFDQVPLPHEPYLPLRRVHVHIDPVARELEGDHPHGEPGAGEVVSEGDPDRLRERTGRDRPPVHREVEAARCGDPRARPPERPFQPSAGDLAADFEGFPEERGAEDARRGVPEVLGCGIDRELAFRPAHPVGDIGTSEVDPLHGRDDLDLLRGRAAQELSPGRRVVEEVGDLDGRADRPTGGGEGPDRSALHREGGRLLPFGGPRDDPQPADGPYRREGFAPEPERLDPVDRSGRVEFARRVPFDRERKLVRRDALAVVRDLDPGETSLVDPDRDRARSRVQRVLDQLLDDGGRSLDDLARGDPLDRGRVEPPDRTTTGGSVAPHGPSLGISRARRARSRSSRKRSRACSGERASTSSPSSSPRRGSTGRSTSASRTAWV